MKLKINSILPVSEVNGPGRRFVIWTQGCLRRCHGCFNTHLMDPAGGYFISIEELYHQITSIPDIEGISVSGGEPFLQASVIYELVQKIKKMTDLTILVFTGMTIDELHQEPVINKCLDYLDVVIAGQYEHNNRQSGTLTGSTNQTINLTTDRYSMHDFILPDSEVTILPDGSLVITGINPVRF